MAMMTTNDTKVSRESCSPYALLREGTKNLHPWIFKPKRFDNYYFINILEGKGLLVSDNVLIIHDLHGKITEQVQAYASNEKLLFASFAKSMIKMGNINVLTRNEGEIRRNCRFVNA